MGERRTSSLLRRSPGCRAGEVLQLVDDFLLQHTLGLHGNGARHAVQVILVICALVRVVPRLEVLGLLDVVAVLARPLGGLLLALGTLRPCSHTRAAISFGWVLFLIP